MIIYILEAHQGSWEDKHQWNVKAFGTKERAEEYKAELEKEQEDETADANRYIDMHEDHGCVLDLDEDGYPYCKQCEKLQDCYDILDSDERVWYRIGELEFEEGV